MPTNLLETKLSTGSSDKNGYLFEVFIVAPNSENAVGQLHEVSVDSHDQGIFLGANTLVKPALKTFTINAVNVPEVGPEPTSWVWTTNQVAATVEADGASVNITPPASFNGTSFTVTATANDGRQATVTVEVGAHPMWKLVGTAWKPIEMVEHWAHQPVIFMEEKAGNPKVYYDPTQTSISRDANGTLSIETTDPGISVDTSVEGVVTFTQEVG